MTEKATRGDQKWASALLGMAVLFLTLLLLKNPTVATECVGRGLALCARAVIPALFPFMVLSELLIACGFGELFGKKLGRPIAALFGISGESAAALVLGFLCGFPVGARMTLTLYDNGSIGQGECERLLGFCNLPSIAFLVSTVGSSLYGSRAFGILLWLSAMASACLVGILSRKKASPQKECSASRLPPLGISTFTSAIANATAAMLSVCAYILFFGALLGVLSHTLADLSVPAEIRALLYGFFELTSGTDAAAKLSNRPLSALFTALAVGWSGLSIHCQLITLCDGRGLSFRFYFLARLAEAVICAILVLIFAPFCF